MIFTLQKLLQKSKEVTASHDAHALALDLVESMLRHYAVVAIAAYRHSGARDPKINRILFEQLPRPSMGSWKNFLQMLAHADPHLFPEQFWDKFLAPLTKKISNPDISAAYAGLKKLADQDIFSSQEVPVESEPVPCTPLEFLDAVVSYRNRFSGHGTHELPDTALKFARTFLKGAVALCNHLNTLWLACPVYVAKQAKLYGRTYFRLTPLVETEGIGEIKATVPGIEEDRLYICFGNSKHPEVESLYPAALWEEAEILFANGTKGMNVNHYIGYTSQRSFETSIYEEDFRTFLEPFLSSLNPEPGNNFTTPVTSPIVPLLKGKLKLTFVSIGIVLLISMVIIGYFRFANSVPHKIKSIAVLPFVDRSPIKDQGTFSDDVAERILTSLAHVGVLRVIASSSSFAFRGDAVNLDEVRRKLNVETVLEGSVRKSENTVLITARLIRLSDKSNLWSNEFRGEISKTLDVQEEIARSVVNELKLRLTINEQAAIKKRPTENWYAYELYLEAKKNYEKGGKKDLEKMVSNCQRAIELDPKFAEAYLGLAYYYGVSSDIKNAKKYIQKALEADSNLPQAYCAMARINFQFEWKFLSAEENFRKALLLNPSLAEAHTWYAQFLRAMGRYEEARKEIEQALALDPLSLDTYAQAMALYISVNEFTAAQEMYDKTQVINPEGLYPKFHLGRFAFVTGKYDSALVIFQEYCNKKGIDPLKYAYVGITYAFSGNRMKAIQVIDALKFDNMVPMRNSSIAEIYAALGENNLAFEWLEKAYQNHEYNGDMVFLKSDPEWKKIRSDRRYKGMLKKIGLPE
jgi:adenylate cyclase